MTKSMKQGFLAVLFNGYFDDCFDIVRALLFMEALCFCLERQITSARN